MARVSRAFLETIATKIRPHITPFLEAKGQISDDEVRMLIKKHTHCGVRSDHSVAIVQELLAEV